ncbi:MAG TPA: alpha/beta fold hydrolase, partial [Rhizomicrobium sp.]|nr:alpha/beta fold hydrolase [Rhizomicrobium sp.]
MGHDGASRRLPGSARLSHRDRRHRFQYRPTPGLIARLDAALIGASTEGPIDVIGQSFGGILALDLARRYPDRVRKVVTLCSPVCVPITTPVAPLVHLFKPFYDTDWLLRHSAAPRTSGAPVIALHTEEDGIV